MHSAGRVRSRNELKLFAAALVAGLMSGTAAQAQQLSFPQPNSSQPSFPQPSLPNGPLPTLALPSTAVSSPAVQLPTSEPNPSAWGNVEVAQPLMCHLGKSSLTGRHPLVVCSAVTKLVGLKQNHLNVSVAGSDFGLPEVVQGPLSLRSSGFQNVPTLPTTALSTGHPSSQSMRIGGNSPVGASAAPFATPTPSVQPAGYVSNPTAPPSDSLIDAALAVEMPSESGANEDDSDLPPVESTSQVIASNIRAASPTTLPAEDTAEARKPSLLKTSSTTKANILDVARTAVQSRPSVTTASVPEQPVHDSSPVIVGAVITGAHPIDFAAAIPESTEELPEVVTGATLAASHTAPRSDAGSLLLDIDSIMNEPPLQPAQEPAALLAADEADKTSAAAKLANEHAPKSESPQTSLPDLNRIAAISQPPALTTTLPVAQSKVAEPPAPVTSVADSKSTAQEAVALPALSLPPVAKPVDTKPSTVASVNLPPLPVPQTTQVQTTPSFVTTSFADNKPNAATPVAITAAAPLQVPTFSSPLPSAQNLSQIPALSLAHSIAQPPAQNTAPSIVQSAKIPSVVIDASGSNASPVLAAGFTPIVLPESPTNQLNALAQTLSTAVKNAYPTSRVEVRVVEEGLVLQGSAASEAEAKKIVSFVRKNALCPVADQVTTRRK
ncbi:MAG: hypothetical protein U0892_07340 [Pirellulales bacterium]